MPGLNILPAEQSWINHYSFLERRGYRLRPRYDPSHIPSREREKPWWLSNTLFRPEDEAVNLYPNVLDALRLTDNTRVVLRKVDTWKDEIPIHRQLASLSKDPRNRLMPVLDMFLLPDTDDYAFIVMPFLRGYYDPPFSRLDQVVQCISQLLEAMEYLHEHDIAHRDFCTYNILMDASNLLPGGHHFAAPCHDPERRFGLAFKDRDAVPTVQYFIADLGLAVQSQKRTALVTGVFGQDKTVPELSWDVPYNPFMVDIYHLGHVIMLDMVEMYEGLDFLRPLAEAMTHCEPRLRPDITTAIELFLRAKSSLPSDALSQPVRVTRPYNVRLIFAPEPGPDLYCCFTRIA